MSDVVRQLSPFTRLGLRLGVVLFRLIIWTLRVKMSPTTRTFLESKPTSSLILIWHNRMLLALSALARGGNDIPLTGLVSASGDGALIAQVMHAFGLQTARGSSSRRAVEATRELISALELGRNVVITPDGPRGPIYTVKKGTVDVGQGHAVAIYLLGLNCSHVWQLKSWDKFMIPKPFAQLELIVEKIDMTAPVDAALLQEKLISLNR